MWVLIPGLGRSPGGGHGNPSSILAWRIPWIEEPGRLQFIGLQRVRHDWSDLAHFKCTVWQSAKDSKGVLETIFINRLDNKDEMDRFI